MKSQLYLPKVKREFLKSQISSYVQIFSKKLMPVFKDISQEAETLADQIFNNKMHEPSYNDLFDAGSLAEAARDEAADYYLYMELGKYHLTAAWHAMLYELWEQQVRKFLYEEISHENQIQFKHFCDGIKKIKNTFKDYGVYIEAFVCWHRIDELRLLCNVIKHSHGGSLDDLLQKNEALVKTTIIAPGDLVELYKNKTSLLKETLNINEMTLRKYAESLISFWDLIPDRNYSKEH